MDKSKQSTQNQQQPSQLESQEEAKEQRERKKKLYLKISDFLLDLAKLVFGGIILTGIIDLNLDRVWLFSVGAVVAGIFAGWGFNIYQRGLKIK